MRTCKGRTHDGRQCRASIRHGSDFCFFHDPKSANARRDAQGRGGSKQARLHVLPRPHPDFDLSSPDSITQVLEYAANCLVRGELDSRSAYTLGFLADCALRAHKIGSLSERLDETERLIRAESEIPLSRDEFFHVEMNEEPWEQTHGNELLDEVIKDNDDTQQAGEGLKTS
jgi:hypothetical protein